MSSQNMTIGDQNMPSQKGIRVTLRKGRHRRRSDHRVEVPLLSEKFTFIRNLLCKRFSPLYLEEKDDFKSQDSHPGKRQGLKSA